MVGVRVDAVTKSDEQEPFSSNELKVIMFLDRRTYCLLVTTPWQKSPIGDCRGNSEQGRINLTRACRGPDV
jgi:hypothetical protein